MDGEPLYRAAIVRQHVRRSKKGYPQLILGVELHSVYDNEWTGESRRIPAEEHPIFLTFVDDEGLRKRVRQHLARLGCEGLPLCHLDPDRTWHRSLVGKRVYVRRRKGSGGTFWHLEWPDGLIAMEEEQRARILRRLVPARPRVNGPSAKPPR